ncbi:MAG TPA: hypothetical protein VKV77_11060 [Methylovirgula sp.]|nr:hypothetical protein [Methylovirgula sp.]
MALLEHAKFSHALEFASCQVCFPRYGVEFLELNACSREGERRSPALSSGKFASPAQQWGTATAVLAFFPQG